jgi:RNA polymerase sigma-70 factor (ECF subfamily)
VNTIEELYNLYYARVFSYILALCKDHNVAEEITQNTFYKSLKSLNSFKGNSDISTWLCTIAKNLYYDLVKKQTRITVLNECISVEEHMENSLCDKDEAFLIHRVLHNLDEPYKEVFMLRVFGELSFTQIGKLFNKTDNWARVTYYRAKSKIQVEMEDNNG